MTSGYGSPSPQYPGEHQRVWKWIFISPKKVYPLVIKCDWLGNPREQWQVSIEIIERNGDFSSKKRLTILIHPHFFEQKPDPVLGGP